MSKRNNDSHNKAKNKSQNEMAKEINSSSLNKNLFSKVDLKSYDLQSKCFFIITRS